MHMMGHSRDAYVYHYLFNYSYLVDVVGMLFTTQAAQLSAQELTDTATVGLDHGKGRGGHWEPIGTSMPPY